MIRIGVSLPLRVTPRAFCRFQSRLGDALNQTIKKVGNDLRDPLDNSTENVQRLRLSDELKREKVAMDITKSQIEELEEALHSKKFQVEVEEDQQKEDKDAVEIKEDSDGDDLKGEAARVAASAKESGKDVPNVSKQINDEIHREIEGLPSDQEKMKPKWIKDASKYFDSLQSTILIATRTLNDVTGYSAIEKLKESIENLEDSLKEAKEQVKKCKKDYADSIQLRSTSQREINELLTRKHNWNDVDLQRFTDLYRNDHTNELREKEASDNMNEAEQRVDAIQLKLTQSILTRYHEEQVWSDKIRRASTWGTWIIMGVNLLLFVVATFFVEPWKRKRLVDAFEAKMRQTMAEVESGDQKIYKEISQLKQENPSTLNEVKDFVHDAVHLVNTTPDIEADYDKMKADDKEESGRKDAERAAIGAQRELARQTPGLHGVWVSVVAMANQVRLDLKVWWLHIVSEMLSKIEVRKVDVLATVSGFAMLGGALGSFVTSKLN